MTAAATGRLSRVLSAWVVTRVLVVLTLVISAEHANFADIGTYHRWSDGAWTRGVLPGRDFAWEYPPGALLVLLIPSGSGGAAFYFVEFLTAMLVADVAITVLLQALGTRRGSFAGVWLWVAVLPLLGPVTLTRYDLVPTGLSALAVAVVGTAPFLAGAVLALGTSVKVWPAIVLLLLLATRQGAARHWVLAGALVSTAVLVSLGAAGGVLPALGSTVSNQLDRGTQVESLAALPFLWLRVLGSSHAVGYHHSSWEVSGSGVGAVAMTLSAAGGLALVLLVLRSARRGPREDLAAVAAAAVGISLLADKVFSPQYLLWLLGLLAVAACRPGALDRRALPLAVATALVTHLVYPLQYAELLDGAVLPLVLLTVRDALLLALCLVLLRPARLPVPQPTPARTAG